MLYLLITISLTIVLLTLGSTWVELAGAFAIAVAVGFGSTTMHSLIERRTHRKAEPRTGRQSTTLFSMGLGGALLIAYFLPNEHPLVSFAGVCMCFFVGDMLGHAFFGTREPYSSAAVMDDSAA